MHTQSQFNQQSSLTALENRGRRALNNKTAIARRQLLRELFTNRIFQAVLLLKLVVGSLFASHYLRDWFTPFVSYFVTSAFSDPWQYFVSIGEVKAFPYHPLMLWIFAVPRALFSPLLSQDWREVTLLHLFVMRLPLLLADLTIYLVLASWFKNRVKQVTLFYWCSPIVLYICYFHGQLDIIPTALFMVSLYALNRRRLLLSMFVLGLALATKAHLLVAIPFLAVFALQHFSFLRVACSTLLTFATYILCSFSYLGSPGFQRMVLQAEEQRWVFAYQMPLPISQTAVYLCPAVLMVFFLRFMAYPKRNWDLTLLYLGMAFCSFVILVPPMQGWFMWAVPFIAYFFCKEQRLDRTGLVIFSAAYLAYFLGSPNSDLFDAARLFSLDAATFKTPYELLNSFGLDAKLWHGILFTLMETSLAVVVLMMYRVGVRSNEVYKPKERATLIGIAGDSGAGKDTLISLVSKIIGPERTIALSGDDYHKWERGNERWQVFTHLDVRTNRLHELLDHTVALKDGRSVMKVSYSHETGQFTNPTQVDSNQYVLISGLHSFVLEKMRQVFDLKIFLDPDESLRRFWKVQRDTRDRGHSVESVLNALDRRERDRQAHIIPQRDNADIVFRLKPIEELSLSNLEVVPELCLEAVISNNFNLEELESRLAACATLQTAVEYKTEYSKQVLWISGQMSSGEIEEVAYAAIPNLEELIQPSATFESGLNGAMQLIFIYCMSTVHRWKGQSVQERGPREDDSLTWRGNAVGAA